MSWYALPSAQWFWEFLCALARNLVGTWRDIHHPQLVGSRFLRLWICIECLSIYVPISLCTDLSMYLCTHPSIHPSIHSMYLIGVCMQVAPRPACWKSSATCFPRPAFSRRACSSLSFRRSSAISCSNLLRMQSWQMHCSSSHNCLWLVERVCRNIADEQACLNQPAAS